jgi:hypothetical protein
MRDITALRVSGDMMSPRWRRTLGSGEDDIRPLVERVQPCDQSLL